ncbi:MAG: pantoate--beta-alanine ligase [bacterium]|jgi:pantoate--beta-alanine ligase|nr:pantoate--beta-alanine ligase [bacterium]
MEITGDIVEVRKAVSAARSEGKMIGFVPTMGSLHEGHISLVRAARRQTGFVVVSIFVNKLQFGPKEDFNDYPRDLDTDKTLLRQGGCDLVFTPQASVMYPPGFVTSVQVAGLTEHLCGTSRPGHFNGVATVVCKLFNIVAPDQAYFGLKDRQQLMIIERMTRNLDIPVTIVGMPIIRERDGLAMSSRNRYLNDKERKSALCLGNSLKLAARLVREGEKNTGIIIERMRNYILDTSGVEPNYIAAVDGEELRPVEQVELNTIFAIAANVGKSRLIDNMQVSEADLKIAEQHQAGGE